MARKTWKRTPQKLATYDPHPHQRTFHQSNKKFRAVVSGVGAG